MSSSTFFTKNLSFDGVLSTDQSPLPGIGGVLSSNINGVFEITSPPQSPSFVDGLTLQTDSSSMGGVKWDTTLTNVGSGEEFFVSPSSLKTLSSNDSSVTITSTANEIDLSVMTSFNALNNKIDNLIEDSINKDEQIVALIEADEEKSQRISSLLKTMSELTPPEIYFTNQPISQSFFPGGPSDGTKVFEYICQKSGTISLIASACFQKTSGTSGTIFLQLRLNGQLFSPSIQSGYEGEQSQYAPDLSGLTINWSGEVNQGDTLSIYGLATSGTFSLAQTGVFSGAAGAQLSITNYHLLN